jgi:hypothetical protein
MENMASFPDLRPHRRSAKAERSAASKNRARLLLVVSAALLLTAFFAVSEFATLRGTKAHDASAFLTRELGPPLDSGSLVGAPAHASPSLVKPALGGKLEIRNGGLKVTSGRSSVSLHYGKTSGSWRGHQHGVQRKLSFGRETIVFGTNRVEQSLTVGKRQGTRTWRWRLDAGNLAAHVAADGTVRFASGTKDSGLRILPVVIFDKDRKDITPGGLRWSLAGHGNHRVLQLRMNDAQLPLPYVIDPIALVAACPGGGCATSTTTNGLAVTVARPASVATGNLMVAHVTLRNNDAITAPAGWTTTGNLRTSGASLEQRIYYRIATAADTAASTYIWAWTTASDGTAAILAYSGTDATNPFDVTPTDNAGSSLSATATGLTTTQANDMLIAFYGAQGLSGTPLTLTQDAGQGLTQEYALASGSSPASRAHATGADGTQASAAATGNKTATVSRSAPWVAHLVALMPPLAADGAGTLTTPTTNVSASQTGNTVVFTYTAAAGGMQNGSITLVVPAGWTAPSLTANNAGYTTASAGTVAVASQTITVSNLTLAGAATMTITYGDKSGGGTGAAATATTGAQTWQAQQKARSAGTLTNLGSSPSITVNAADGSGTLTTPTTNVSASQIGNTLTFTYTAAAGGINNGTVTLVVPAGWSAPSTTGANAGYSTSSAGTLAVAAQTITVSSLTLAGGSTFTIVYGSTAGGGPGATATSSTGAQTWQAQAKSTAGGTLANLGASPSITVYAADGSGTLTTPTSVVSASQTGRTITFTYTAAAGGINNGKVTLVVPAGWSAPSTTGANAGYSTASTGTLAVAAQTITVSSVTLAGGSTFTIVYGSTAGGGPGATAASSTGAQTWQAQAKSTSAGTLANLGASPSITVYAADGTGTLTTPTSVVSASQTGRTITFTYTAAAGGINNGSVTLVVPAGWSAPSTTSANAGYTTASTGTVAVAAQTITVSSVTLAGGSTMTVTYGDTGSGGPGATATSSTGAQTWQTQEKSTAAGSLANLAASPSITVYAADGSGTLTTPTTNVSASQTGRTATFTYTAATGGINNGTVTLVVPAGWSAPSTTGANAGYSTSSAGTLAVAAQTITVSSLTLAGGSTFTITYGDTGGGGPGATASSSTGAQTWQAQAKSTSAGTLANLGASPSITVNAADGTGTLTTPTSVVSASQTGRTITYTYTAAAGGINNGTVTLVVPAGWSAPSTTGANAGYTTASTGTVAVAAQTITVSSVTLAGGSTFTIFYGDTGGGGPGATATSSTGAQTWQAQAKSTSAGTLANLGASPSITVNAADGSGTLTTPTTNVSASQTGRTITFTYTAATGGINNGTVTLVAPTGWSAPSTTAANAGYSTSSAGTLAVAAQTITVSSVTLAGGSTFTITYGDTGGGGPGATASSSTGAQTWQAQEKSTSAGSLANLGASPSITVNAADGSGTLTTPTTSVPVSSTGNTITFTYTAAAGGINNGSVTLVVPAGWSAPSTTAANAGYSTSSAGTLTVSSQTITVASLTVAGGGTFTIIYGDTAGATAPVPAGGQTWQAREKSSSGGTLTNLASSPSITVNDITPPSAPALTYGSFTNASATGTTVYIRQGVAGWFTVTGTSSDVESGIDHLTFASGLGAGWTGGGADSSSPYTGVYTFNSSATAPAGNQDVTATNGWGLTSSATPFTVVADTTAPSVTAPSVTAGYYTSLSVPVTKNGGTDGGSGVDNSTSSVQRDEVALTNGSCGSFPGTWSSVTLVGGNDTTVVSGSCYRYRELLSDNVGNQGSSPASNTAKVDTTAPSTPSLAFGGLSANAYYDGVGAFYFRPSAGGTFTVTATSTDAQSGIGSYTFGTLNSNGGSNFGGSQTGDHFDYTFGAATTAPSTARNVSSTNGAGINSANATYTIAADTTSPSVTAPGVTAGYYTSNSVPVTKNGGSDGGSGVDNTTSILQRDVANLANGSCGSFSGSWTTVTLSGGNDTSVTNGHCYQYRELLSDRVGNQGTSAASNIAKVDSLAPANSITLTSVSPAGSALKNGVTIYYHGSLAGGGSFKLTNAVTDAEAGPASSTTAALGGSSGGWSHTPSTVSTPSGGPFDSNTFSWNAGTTSSPTEVVTAADQAGNTTPSATLTLTNDSNPPAGGALTVNGTGATGGGSSSYSTSGSFPIDVRTDYSETQSATESGLASSTLTRATATLTGNSCGSFGSASTISGAPAQSLSTGCYLYTLTGTDNLGNNISISTTVKVDTSAPSAPSLTFSNASGALYASGTNAWFNPSSAGSIDLAASSSDGDTGISSYTFPSAAAMGTSWSAAGSGASRTYSFVSGAAEPGTKSVSATNGAGGSASSNFTISADSAAPSTTIQCNAAACLNGTYYTSSPVSVTLSANDGTGSGVQKIRYTTNGTDPTPVNGTDYTGAISINSTTTVKYRAYDNLGNEEAVGSQDILVDNTPPNLSLTLTENPASGAQHVSGTTLFYRPGAGGGTFRVTATADDPQTGVASVDFPSIANVTGGSSQTSSPYREDYTWNASTTDATAHNVVATNGAAATTSVPFTLTQDSAAPTGQSITLTGANAPYYGSASVSFSLGDGTDPAGGSGLDTSTRTVTRESATLSGDSCGTFTADAGTYSSPDTAVSNGHCYRYTFSIGDNVGNVSTPVSATAKVDTQAPSISVSTPTALTGSGSQYYDTGTKTQFFRSTSSGSFRLNAAASDSETNVTAVTFPDISSLSGWSGSTGGADPTSPYSSPADYTWSSGAADPGARTISASDKAANSATDSITIKDDSAAPTGQSVTLTGANAPYYSTASVTFSLADGSDGSGSGLDTATRSVTRETGDLVAGSCSNFSADAGSFSSPDTAVSSGHCYRYTFTIADRVGNVSSAITATAKVDTDGPSVAVTAPTELTGAANQYYNAGSQTQFFRPGGSGSFSLHATASDAQSGVAQVAFPNVSAVSGWAGSIGGADSSSPYTSPNDYTWSAGASAPGARTITATNGAGIDGTATITLAADSTAPSGQTITLTGANAPYYNTASVSFSLGDGSDSGSGLDTASRTVTRESATLNSDSCGSFTADAGTYTSPDTTVTNGHCYRYSFTIADNVNNTSTSVTTTAKVDTVAPTTTIDSSPANPSNNTTPSFSFSSSEAGSTFACRIDGGSWTSCSSPNTISPALTEGSHTFQVRATDIAGNTDATPASYTWTVDLTPPNTTIDSSPPSPSGNATPTFTFSSNEPGSTFECRIDGGSWTSCSSPDTISLALTQGSHTFDVRAIDPAGNTDPTPASYTWIIDTGAPTVTITSPTTYLNSSDPNNYVVTATTPDTDVTRVDFFECSDASTACATGSWVLFGTDNTAPYAATWSTPAFDGLKAIRAVAVDAAGNTGQHVRTITIDRTAPTGVTVTYPNGYVTGSFAVTTSNGPDPDVNAATGSLERQTGNLANDTCSSYGAWVAATSPDTLASGKCAKYRYSVSDNAGNLAVATSANETKSDTAAPTSTLTDPGANLRQTITLSASAGDTGGSGVNSVAFQRRPAGGGSWTTIAADNSFPYSVSFDTTTVADGLYDFRSVATDTAGNVEAAPAVIANRRVDNTPPSATMLSPGNPVGGPVTLTSTTSDTGGSGIATVAYELAPNGGSFNSQSQVWDTTLVSDGLYDLRVVATDVAGNSTTSTIVTTRVDNTPPAITFSSPATGTIVSGTVSLVGSATDASPASPPVTFAYKLHSDPPSAYAATGASWNTATLPAGDGLYDLRARATDDAGNTATVENTSIRVDNTPPTVSITAPPAAINGSLPSPTTFAANASDTAGSGVAQVQFFECSDQSNDCATGIWNPLGTVPAPGPYSVSWSIPAADGNHALAAVATDNAGHPATAIRNVNVDRTAPSTTILTKPSDPSNAAVPSFTFDSSEAGSTFECRIDGGAFTPCTSPHNVPGLTDNTHTFDVRATDPAGNTDATPATWTWHRDTNNPTGTLNSPGANIRQTVPLTSTETDPPANGYASGLQAVTYEYSANGTTWAPIGTLNSAPFGTILWNTSGVSDGVYQLRVVVLDVAGNSTTSSTVPNVRIDNTPPTTSQNDPGQYLRGTKTLTGSAADSGSGIDHVDFQRAPTGGGPWTTIGTDTTPGAGFQVSFDTTSVPDGHYDFRTVAYDVAGNQASATPVTDRLIDNTAPNATINSPGPYLRGAVNLTSSTSDPGGSNASGVATVAYEYSTNGGGTWQSTGASFNSAAVPDGNVSLHVVATDAAGNTTTSAAVTSLADNTKPATTDNAPSGWQSSPVTVTLTANDGGSGVNVTEYSVDGNPIYTVGTSVVIPAPSDGSNDGAHTIAYFSVDNAGNIETIKSTTVLIDATPPTCPACSVADYLRGTVTLSADPGPSASGIKSVAFEYTDHGGSSWTTIGTDTTGPGPYTAVWDTTPVPDGHYDLRIQITDNANNVTTTSLPDKVVDNTAPNVALVGAPTQGQFVSGTIAIAASASDATSPIYSVKFFVGGSLLGTDTTAPYSLNWDTTTGPDGPATIQIVVEDMAGNTTTSAVRDVSVDNVSPTPTLADPGQYLNGTVSLSVSSDADTTQVDFERRPAGGGAWVTIASDTTMPWSTSLDTTTLADGLYDFRAIATDQTGHTGTSPIRANIRIDNTAPAGSLVTPASGATVGGTSVGLSGSYSDSGSGVASVRYELRPTGGGSWTTIATATSAPFSANWDPTTVSSGSYDMQPVITDRAGNTFTGAMRTITVSVTAPTIVLTNPGAIISGLVTLNATVSGPGATQVVFAATPAGGASWSSVGTVTSAPWSAAFDTSQLQDGVYDLRASVSDNLGNTSSDVVTAIRIDNTAPSVVSSTPGEGTTVPSANAIGLVTSEPATPVGVTLDGNATVVPVVNGTNIDYGTGALGVGPHTLAGELQDAAGKKAPFRVHFTVWTASSSLAPPVNKNTTTGAATTVDSADGWASATMPAGNWSSPSGDWIVLRITPLAPPAGLTNGFGAGPITVDVTASWALAGTMVHQFNRPIGILLRSTQRGLVPATLENGQWRVLSRVPSAGTLPTGWEDGFYTDSAGFHIMTKHLSVFGLLHDLEAPNPPQNVRGYLGPTGLTLRWTPGADNSGTYDFVTVFSDSTDAGHFGVDFTAASIGPWSAGDPRIFRLKETDLAGNESSLTQPLRPVPSLIGKTPDQAAALLAPLGLKVGTTTTGGTGPAGTITGPAGLALAEAGSAIDVTVSPGAGFTQLLLKVTTAPRVKPAVRNKIAARVSLTRAARVTAELFSPRHVKLYTWRFSLKAGRSIVKLRLPHQVRRSGIYTIRWTARSGREAISRQITIRLVGASNVVVAPIEVLLAGPAANGISGKLPARAPKLITASGIEPTFDAAASPRTDVRVIVVDVDAFGVSLISDLHAVFPSAKIVALTSGPRQMATSLRAGAAIALPRSTPASLLARVINRLVAKPAKPAKPAGPSHQNVGHLRH